MCCTCCKCTMRRHVLIAVVGLLLVPLVSVDATNHPPKAGISRTAAASHFSLGDSTPSPAPTPAAPSPPRARPAAAPLPSRPRARPAAAPMRRIPTPTPSRRPAPAQPTRRPAAPRPAPRPTIRQMVTGTMRHMPSRAQRPVGSIPVLMETVKEAPSTMDTFMHPPKQRQHRVQAPIMAGRVHAVTEEPVVHRQTRVKTMQTSQPRVYEEPAVMVHEEPSVEYGGHSSVMAHSQAGHYEEEELEEEQYSTQSYASPTTESYSSPTTESYSSPTTESYSSPMTESYTTTESYPTTTTESYSTTTEAYPSTTTESYSGPVTQSYSSNHAATASYQVESGSQVVAEEDPYASPYIEDWNAEPASSGY